MVLFFSHGYCLDLYPCTYTTPKGIIPWNTFTDRLSPTNPSSWPFSLLVLSSILDIGTLQAPNSVWPETTFHLIPYGQALPSCLHTKRTISPSSANDDNSGTMTIHWTQSIWWSWSLQQCPVNWILVNGRDTCMAQWCQQNDYHPPLIGNETLSLSLFLCCCCFTRVNTFAYYYYFNYVLSDSLPIVNERTDLFPFNSLNNNN